MAPSHVSCFIKVMPSNLPSLLVELRTLLGPDNVIDQGDSLETLSKDFYWYSPVLKRQLDDKRADAIVRPGSLDELRATLAACTRARVAVVPRGAGTGNYGQCVPIYGGVVLDLIRLDRILEITTDGVLRAEPGARMGKIEIEVRKAGWELRCMPSTWMKSSLGGFFCGGSGGIGSITWGGINAGDNVKAVTLMTCEEEPKLVVLEELETIKALHTYGTTGVMVEIQMRLAPKVDYDQLIFSAPDWDALMAWTDAAARNGDWHKREVSQYEWPTPSFFKPLNKYFRPGEHVSFLLVDRAHADAMIAAAAAVGIANVYRQPLPDPPKPPFLTDYSWNHTTLWAMKSDPTITYLQALFTDDFRAQIAEIHRRYPGEVLMHLEWMAGTPKMMKTVGSGAESAPGAINVGCIPLVYFKSEERLNEIQRALHEIGVALADPHTYRLEGGGHHPNIAEKRTLKRMVDPQGLLNPGKMQSYPHNPFDPAESAAAAATSHSD